MHRAADRRNGRSGSGREEIHYIAMEFDRRRDAARVRRQAAARCRAGSKSSRRPPTGSARRTRPASFIATSSRTTSWSSAEGYAKVVDFGLAKLRRADRGWNPIGADSPTMRAHHAAGRIDRHGRLHVAGADPRRRHRSARPTSSRSAASSTKRSPARGRSTASRSSTRCTRCCTSSRRRSPHRTGDAAGAAAHRRASAWRRTARIAISRSATSAIDLRQWLHQGEAIGAQPRRDHASQLRIALLATTLAVLPVLGWIFLGHRDVSTAAAPQQSIRRVTTNGRTPLVAISPDARYVAYVAPMRRRRSGLDRAARNEVHTAARLRRPPVTTSRSSSRDDNNYLYYVRYDINLMADLFRIPMLGGKSETCWSTTSTRGPDFSPDGEHVGVRARRFQQVDEHGDGGERERQRRARSWPMLRLPDRAYSPAWSRDGQHIVVAQPTKLIDIAWPQGTMREITTHPHFDSVRNVTWSDRSTLIVAAVQEQSSGHARLWEVDASSGEARPMSDELADLSLPSVSADGKTIAAVQTIRQANLFNYDDHGVRQITSGLGSTNGLYGLAWLGDKVLYSSTTDGASSIWTADPLTGAATKLTEGPDDLLPAPSPDGSLVVYESAVEGSLDVVADEARRHRSPPAARPARATTTSRSRPIRRRSPGRRSIRSRTSGRCGRCRSPAGRRRRSSAARR